VRADIKAKWVAALRSGEYKQGRGRLKFRREGSDEAEFCCLGVLCDILDKDNTLTVLGVPVESRSAEIFETGREVHATEYLYADSSAYLPEKVVEYLRMPSSDPEVGPGRPCNCGGTECEPDRQTLASLNDGGRSFEEIAALIESEL
jgi:hypothetical protein